MAVLVYTHFSRFVSSYVSTLIEMAHRRELIRSIVQKTMLYVCKEVSDILINELSKKKRVWIRKWLSRRNKRGASSTLLTELALEDVAEYRNSMRMTRQQFNQLLNKITCNISKCDTIMRDAIPAKVKLEITLSYLATGNSYRSLQRQFRVSRPAISKFIPEVCDAIYENLKEYIKVSAKTKFIHFYYIHELFFINITKL